MIPKIIISGPYTLIKGSDFTFFNSIKIIGMIITVGPNHKKSGFTGMCWD